MIPLGKNVSVTTLLFEISIKSCIEKRAKVSHNGVKGDGIEYKGFYY